MSIEGRLGATYLGNNQCQFLVWAPFINKVDLQIVSPEEKTIALNETEGGYHWSVIENINPGCKYYYILNMENRYPDPASRFQPDDVHGPSQVIDLYFPWSDSGWRGLPLQEYVIYELHAGTFTEEGTFDAIITRLDELKNLGITALELMPVAQFPGHRNWGYDGVYPFAVQNSYGGPDGLRRLVDACHQRGLAVILDVVYNHFGPEGNYMDNYGPYFTDVYRTPWGAAINFDGPYSDDIRRFFIENALQWLTDFHIDALRLDALHSIFDNSSFPFIEELSQRFHQQAKSLRRSAYLIGESAANDSRLIRPQKLGGYGLDAQWNDDFHHSLHVLLTGENGGYYQDFDGAGDLVKAFNEGFVYTGQYSSYRKRRHGRQSMDIPANRFVVFSQNHDQVGNRLKGDRLSEQASFEKLKLAAGTVILSPFIPLLFMGEEYGETAPFAYFVHHSDPSLIEAVRTGRRDEFASFQWQGNTPDPQEKGTFLRARLNHALKEGGWHQLLLSFYHELIHIRKQNPVFASLNKKDMKVKEVGDNILWIHRWKGKCDSLTILVFTDFVETIKLPFPEGCWNTLLDSASRKWGGNGSDIPGTIESFNQVELELNPWSSVVFIKES